MKYRILTVREICDFQHKFKTLGGVNLPENYLQDSRVVGAFDEHQQLIGGWTLRLVKPFRALELIPAHSPQVQTFMEKAGLSNIVELNGVWIDPKVTTTKESFRFWREVLRDTIAQKRKYIVFGYPESKQGLKRFYERLDPNIIFTGETVFGVEATVAYLTPSKIRNFYFKQAPWLLCRHFNLIKRSGS